jgi:Tol biopolymer transport system component
MLESVFSLMNPALTGDGTALLYTAASPGRFELRIRDLGLQKDRRLLELPRSETWVSSRDGRRLAFSNRTDADNALFVMELGGTPARIDIALRYPHLNHWSLDGRFLLLCHTVRDAETTSGKVSLLDLVTRQPHLLVERKGWNLYQPRFSPDDRWIVIGAGKDTESRLFILPLEESTGPHRKAAPVEEWIPIGFANGWDDKPRWSSQNGDAMYFVSDHDGHICIWLQKLDHETKRPFGPPRAVKHFHDVRTSTSNISIADLELDVSPRELVINVGEWSGNIWKIAAR